LAAFRCTYGRVRPCTGGIVLNRDAADALGVSEDAVVSHVARF
jgi:arginine N-succinyltransferase